MATLSNLESEARDLIGQDRAADTLSAGGWNHRQSVRNVFWAMWSASLPTDRVIRLAAALNNENEMRVDGVGLRQALRALVKSGLLRSRICHGGRHYELNLK